MGNAKGGGSARSVGDGSGSAATTVGRLSIGALSRATGIPIETIRTWEMRYGFPVPERKPSGHRLYPASAVPRLQRVAEALRRGLRAGEVVGASEADLAALLEATSSKGAAALDHSAAAPAMPVVDLSEVLVAVEAFDADRLTRILMGDWIRLGALSFLETRIAPLVRAVGERWADGRLQIGHEHFVSARVGDLLRALRLPFEDRASGPLVVLATLPGEVHALGLQMAALVLAAAGCRILYLGTEAPVEQVASLARGLGARGVALSVSRATRGERTRRQLARLRGLIPRRIAVVVGGEGAHVGDAGLTVLQSLSTLDAWARFQVTGSR